MLALQASPAKPDSGKTVLQVTPPQVQEELSTAKLAKVCLSVSARLRKPLPGLMAASTGAMLCCRNGVTAHCALTTQTEQRTNKSKQLIYTFAGHHVDFAGRMVRRVYDTCSLQLWDAFRCKSHRKNLMTCRGKHALWLSLHNDVVCCMCVTLSGNVVMPSVPWKAIHLLRNSLLYSREEDTCAAEWPLLACLSCPVSASDCSWPAETWVHLLLQSHTPTCAHTG